MILDTFMAMMAESADIDELANLFSVVECVWLDGDGNVALSERQ